MGARTVTVSSQHLDTAHPALLSISTAAALPKAQRTAPPFHVENPDPENQEPGLGKCVGRPQSPLNPWLPPCVHRPPAQLGVTLRQLSFEVLGSDVPPDVSV